MTTFTLRASEMFAARLIPAEMRVWLEDFLHAPHALPPHPGHGDERISLTLPPSLVEAASTNLRCSTSATLRRIAVERMEAGGGAESDSRAYSDFGEAAPEPEHRSSQARTMAAALIHALSWMLLMGVWFYSTYRKKKGQLRA